MRSRAVRFAALCYIAGVRLALSIAIATASCAGAQVNHRWDSHGRQFRDGGIQVAKHALRIQADDLAELGRQPVLQLGMLVVRIPATMSPTDFEHWLLDRAAQVGGTHMIPFLELEAAGPQDWLEPMMAHDRDVQDGATHYVVVQVRPSAWANLSTSLQPERQP